MKKADLINALHSEGFMKKDADAFLTALGNIAAETLRMGEVFAIHGIVKITPTDRPARMGVNPATGAAVQIAAKRTLKAKASAELLKAA